jgi:hypothetical protein
MNTALQKAIDNLQIHDVYLRTAVAELGESFEPKYSADADFLRVEFKHAVTQSAVLELSDDGNNQQLFRVFIELGARWVDARPPDAGADIEPAVKARIECVMVAEYAMQEHPGDEALRAFAVQNASYHVWPYWREFLASQCVRMNLPKITLPAVQFAANRKDQAAPT